MQISPLILENEVVCLSPLKREHRQGLLEAAADGELWNLWYTSVPSKDTIDAYIEAALDQQAQGLALPFVVVEKVTNKIVGSTRFCNIASQHKRLEIGYTWYAKTYQRTGLNTACKYLLLTHAFERLGVIAVEFRTHWFNQASRQAILRLGAKQDGVLRNHQLDKKGNIRDTVVFSIIQSEWATLKYALQFQQKTSHSK